MTNLEELKHFAVTVLSSRITLLNSLKSPLALVYLTFMAFLYIISNRILTVGHEKLGYEVNVPVTSSAH